MSAKNPPHLEELVQFLKARRSEPSPTALGLPPGDYGTRRVSGLRREEVAAHTAISHDYYSRIEQGRLAPSPPDSTPSHTRCASHRFSAPTSKGSPDKPTGARHPGSGRRRRDRRSSASWTS
ncbi:helix-turn-helix domain-containing protein [Streptomyces sp. NPDC002911]